LKEKKLLAATKPKMLSHLISSVSFCLDPPPPSERVAIIIFSVAVDLVNSSFISYKYTLKSIYKEHH
jgi:hypothetical protein